MPPHRVHASCTGVCAIITHPKLAHISTMAQVQLEAHAAAKAAACRLQQPRECQPEAQELPDCQCAGSGRYGTGGLACNELPLARKLQCSLMLPCYILGTHAAQHHPQRPAPFLA